MKYLALIPALAVTATPALAHADRHFHTHGAEVFLILAAAVVYWVVKRSDHE